MVSDPQQLFDAPQAGRTSDEYYTPRWVFDCLGLRFDLDVAAPVGGSDTVPADHHFTVTDDGLAQPWSGRVWMNPPYSNVTPWWERFKAHANGIALLPCAKSKWFYDVFQTAEGLNTCRVNFIGGDVAYPVIFVAFGEDNLEALERIGRVR